MWLSAGLLAILFIIVLLIFALVFWPVSNGGKRSKSPRLFSSNVLNAGVNPAGMALTLDGKWLYVANNNNDTLTGSSSVSVLPAKCSTCYEPLTITDPSFNQPYTVTITKTTAYVTNSNTTTISMIDLKTNVVTGVISGFDGPSGMVIVQRGTLAYVNNYGSPSPGVGSGNGTTVSVVNLTTNTIIATITVNQAPAALARSSDGRFVYVVSYVTGLTGSGTLQVIDTSTNTIVQTLSSGLSGPFDIVVDDDARFAYVANFGSNNFWPYGTTVSVIDLSTMTIVNTINTGGIQPSGLVLYGHYLLVTLYNSLYNGGTLVPGEGTVIVYDLKSNRVLQTVAVGQSPANIIARGKHVWVSNYISNTVNRLEIVDP